MTKLYCLLALCLLLIFQSKATTPAREFGKVSTEELTMKSYAKDPDAEALVLFDLGESYFFDTPEGGYDIRFTRTKRIKVFNRAGVKFAEASIPFYVDGYGKTERIVSIEAYSYRHEEGQVIKQSLDKSSVYEEIINERWRVKKFVIPDVQPGSVIEYKYVLETPFHFNLPDWTFQDRIPTAHSQYTVKMIPFYEYVFLAQGISNFDFQESKEAGPTRSWGSVSKSYGQNIGNGVEFKDMVHVYGMKDVPAFRDESYITSVNDYLIKLDFQLSRFHRPTGGSTDIISTWPELIKGMLKSDQFGKYMKGSSRQAKKILEEELKLAQADQLEKSKAIVEYAKKSFTWNDFNSKYSSKSPKEFHTQRTGNAADINLFLCALLNEAGIKAHPVILSTRRHGKVAGNYPFDHFFDYVVVWVDLGDNGYLADATEPLVAFNRLPIRCMNEKGLVVAEKDVLWVGLHQQVSSLDQKTLAIKIDPENLKAKASVTAQSTEFEALSFRKSLANDSASISAFLLEQGFDHISRIKAINYDKVHQPYIIAWDGTAAVEVLDQKLVVAPFLGLPIKESGLTQATRAYPIDLVYAHKKAFTSIIEIPQGYALSSLPQEFAIDSKLASINIRYVKKENTVEVQGIYEFKKNVYSPQEYSQVKNCFDIIVRKFNEPLVFEKR